MRSYLDYAYDIVVALCKASQLPENREAIGKESQPMSLGLQVQGDIASYLAAAHVYLYDESGDDEHLRLAREYLRLPTPVMAFGANALWVAVNGLRRNHVLTDADEQHLYSAAMKLLGGVRHHHFERTPGFRIFNHAVTTASLADVAYRLWPHSAEAERYASEAEGVWNEWWILGENIEGAPNYEAFAQCHILHWAKRRGELDRVVNDPRTLAWMDRGIEHIPPIGFVPGFGDSHSTELWGDWFGLMAIIAAWSPGSDAAALKRKGRARWAAEQIVRWYGTHEWVALNTRLNDRPEARILQTAHRIWWHVVWMAYYLAEGRHLLLSEAADVRPVPPDIMPTITHRTMPSHDLIRNGSWSLVPPTPGPRTPDKGLLRLGTDPTAPFCMMALARQYWHDHMDIGAIDHFSVDEKVLIDDNGYDQKLPVDHNLFFAARESEPWLDYQPGDWSRKRGKVASFGPVDFQVRGLTGRNVAQMIVAECRGPNEMPIYSERTVLLGRTGELVVRDRVIPYSDDVIGSPIWHTQHVRDRRITTGTAYVEVEITDFRGGNGVNARQSDARLLICDPLGTVESIDGDGYEQVDQSKPEYVLRPDMTEEERSGFDLHDSAHVTRTCLFRRRLMCRDVSNHFITVLVPASHAKSPNPARLIDRPSDDGFVLDVNGALVVLNEGANTLSGDWGTTDAAALWVDAYGVFAHRVKRIELSRDGYPPMSLKTDSGPLDIDLSVNGDDVTGHLSAEHPSDVNILVGTKEHTIRRVFGITTVTRFD